MGLYTEWFFARFVLTTLVFVVSPPARMSLAYITVPPLTLGKVKFPPSPPQEAAMLKGPSTLRNCNHHPKGKGKPRARVQHHGLGPADFGPSHTPTTAIILPPSPPQESILTTKLSDTSLGTDHSKCHLNCGVRRGLMMDGTLCGQYREGE